MHVASVSNSSFNRNTSAHVTPDKPRKRMNFDVRDSMEKYSKSSVEFGDSKVSFDHKKMPSRSPKLNKKPYDTVYYVDDETVDELPSDRDYLKPYTGR